MKATSAAGDFPARLAERMRAAGLRRPLALVAISQYEQYYQLLSKWNRRINLTSLPLDGFPARTLDKLFVEPLLAAEFVEDSSAVCVDLGSGGGSPALPLKIVRPRVAITMVESRSRKAAFLREASSALGLSAVDVLTNRIEELGNRVKSESVDFVTVRAVKLDSAILRITLELLRPSGRLFLFGVAAGSDPITDARGSLRPITRQILPSAGGCLTVLEKL